MEFPHFQHEVMDEHPGDALCMAKPGLEPCPPAFGLVFVIIITIIITIFIIVVFF